MSEKIWSEVDAIVEANLIPSDPALDWALQASAQAGLPAIQVSPAQGKLLHLLALTQRARRILEIGTLGGYSAIWLGRALPRDGKLISLELNPDHARVARASLAHAGLDSVAEVKVGPALETLAQLAAELTSPFDFIFIDADKANIPEYFRYSLRLSRPGSVILVDNVVRRLKPDADPLDPHVIGVRRFLNDLKAEKRVASTVIQTVGSKGYDGFAYLSVLP
jgi:predicted O-methyltransferase YrrM